MLSPDLDQMVFTDIHTSSYIYSHIFMDIHTNYHCVEHLQRIQSEVSENF